jgi:hypothetical protein
MEKIPSMDADSDVTGIAAAVFVLNRFLAVRPIAFVFSGVHRWFQPR